MTNKILLQRQDNVEFTSTKPAEPLYIVQWKAEGEKINFLLA